MKYIVGLAFLYRRKYNLTHIITKNNNDKKYW